MKLIALFTIILSFTANGQDWKHLVVKQDSISGKYGFVDSTDKFVIKPQFDQVREFTSNYTSVKVDTLWGIINTKGEYKIQPNFKRISIVYRDHFIEYGENMKFRSISGNILYEYLYIPGPFSEMTDYLEDQEVKQLEDYELLKRVHQMYGYERKPCHYYQQYRPYNLIAIDTKKYAKMTIDFVLDEPMRVKSWIEKDKQFEKDFEDGKVGCCSYGPFWWGE